MKKDYDKALSDYDEAIRRGPEDPANAGAYLTRARIRAECPDARFRDGRLAVESASKACQLTDWKDADCLVALSTAHAECRDYDSAFAAIDKAIVLLERADKKQARGLSVCYACRAHCRYQQKDYENALQDSSRAIELDPTNARWFVGRAKIFWQQQDFGKALDDYDHAVKLKPLDESIRKGRAQLLGVIDDERALAKLNAAISESPHDAKAFSGRAQIWMRKNQVERALADFSEAIRLDPEDGHSRFKRGELYNMKAEYANALADYDEVIRREPESPASIGAYQKRFDPIVLRRCTVSRWASRRGVCHQSV